MKTIQFMNNEIIKNQKENLKKLENIGLSEKKLKKYKKLFFNGTLTLEQEKELLKIIEKKHKCEETIEKYNNQEKEKNKLLKYIADLENKLKLIQKEEKIKLEKKEEEIIKTILPILDILELAMEHVNEETPLSEGIKNTIKKFYSILELYNIYPIENKEFNPELHQAIGIEYIKNKPKNFITKVHQKGFIKNNKKLIRPSLVSVNQY